MRVWLTSLVLMSVVGACAPATLAEAEPPVPAIAARDEVEVAVEPEPEIGLTEATPSVTPVFNPSCSGIAKQGGLLICQLPAGAKVFKGATSIGQADGNGMAVVGLRQHEDPMVTIAWNGAGADDGSIDLAILPRKDDLRELTGLECDKVDARTAEQKAHAARSWTKKVDAFARFEAPVAEALVFEKPADGRYTSPFGPTRHYTGVSAATGKTCEKTSVHRGLDMATPVGTPLAAPLGGVVTLADLDLYYEGGTIFLDHGHGLVSVFMHLSGVTVEPGDIVQAGEVIGATGNTGRTTGPHLHWAVKWRPLDTAAGGGFYIDPALLLTIGKDGTDVESAEQDPAR